MTDKQMQMYLDGTTTKIVREANEYESEQWKRAFMEGTKRAWQTYRANITRRINKVYKETGVRLDYSRF